MRRVALSRPALAFARRARLRCRPARGIARADRLLRAHLWLAPRRVYVSSLVKAMLLVAYLREEGQLDAGCGRASRARPDDHGVLDNGRADEDLSPRGRRGIEAARAAGTHAALLGRIPLGRRPLQRARPGPLLPALRPPRAAPLARLRAPVAVLDHARPALGLLPSPRRVGFKTFFKGGWRGRAPVSSCTRRCSSAGTPASRWRCSLTATPRTPMAPRRCEGSPSGSPRAGDGSGSGTFGGGARPRPGRHARAPACRPRRRPPPAPGVRLDIVYAGRNNLTGHRLAGYCEPWALPWTRRRVTSHGPSASCGGGARPGDPRRLSPGAGLPGARALGAAERARRPVGTYIARCSAHNAGSAVDATLVRIGDGRRLRMGRYDALGPGAHTLSATGRVAQSACPRAGHAALRLRRLLARVVALRAPRRAAALPRPGARLLSGRHPR